MSSFGASNTSNIMINWSECRRELPEWSGLEHLPQEEGLAGGRGLFSLASGAPNSSIPNAYGQVTGKMKPGPSLQGMKGEWESVSWNWRFWLGIKKIFLTTSITVTSLHPWVFKTQVAKALRNLVWFHRWPGSEQDVGLDTPWNSIQPQLFNNWFACVSLRFYF